MHDIGLILFSGIALILLPLPVRMHWRAGNASTLINIFWLFLGNLVFFVNAITWWDSYAVFSEPWCDISVKIQTGLPVGLAAASLLINKRLASIATSRNVSLSHRQRRIAFIVDICVGFGLPALVMVLSYIVQPHRFNIIEGYGCDVVLWSSLPAIFLVVWWPPLLNLISVVFGFIAIRFFLTRRLQFQSLLKSSQSGLNTSQYLRLIALASADLILGLPLNIWFLVRTARYLLPWTSWEDVHYGWSFVRPVPAQDYGFDSTLAVDMALPRWLFVLMAYVFLIFFAVTEDAIREYSHWYNRVRNRFSKKTPSQQ